MRKNLLASNPIIVNEKYEVIDGQHRLEVAKNCNLEIYYTVQPKSNLEDVQRMNSFTKAWTLNDFIDSYIARGNNNYVILKSFMEKYGLAPSTACGILYEGGKRERPTQTIIEDVKNGDFEVRQLGRALEIGDQLLSIRNYVENGAWRTREFIHSLHIVTRKISFDVLMRKLEVSNMKIPKKPNVKDYLRIFEDIYNWKSRGEHVRFF